MKRWATPAAVLFLLSPAIAELLSSSSSPAEFFRPFTFLLLASFYGSGALIVRELTQRWAKGWPSILLLGAAYGIVEEGLAVKSFFDPTWMDLGTLGMYGRWAGVNWVWALGLTIYHAVFSIGIPILLVTRMFPDLRHRPWLSRGSFRTITIVFAAVTLFIHVALTPYRPPVAALALAALSVAGLAVWARRIAAPHAVDDGRRLPSIRRIGAAGFAATVGLFVLLWAAPNTPLPAAALILLTAAYAVGMWTLFGRWAAHPAWRPAHSLAAAAGALTFFILLSPLVELDRNRPDNTAGMTLVGVATAAFLVWLARRVRRESSAPAT